MIVFHDFTVLFPEDRVAFGDIRPKTITPYVRVPHGVGSYAAFSFMFNGAPVRQRVMDFATWKRLSGMAFTYHIGISPEGRPYVNILDVTKDR